MDVLTSLESFNYCGRSETGQVADCVLDFILLLGESFGSDDSAKPGEYELAIVTNILLLRQISSSWWDLSSFGGEGLNTPMS